ncbi:MAG: regulatory iron-sulfur-containing complex subunit RicT [Bacilli bacterium]
MTRIAGISYQNNGQIFYFDSTEYDLKKYNTVIVETEKGIQYGYVTVATFESVKNKEEFNKILRVTTKEDDKIYQKNIELAKETLIGARKIAEECKLNLRIIDASYNFERTQLLFKFLADTRVDFRELVKKLAYLYKTRIELRQIGVRDKAKEIGGIGPCGRELCCSKYLTDFTSVSINMAKNQNIALNPNKINGVCGRLMCCLNYEDEMYNDLKKGMLSLGMMVDIEEGYGRIVNVDIFNKKYMVEVRDKGQFEKDISEIKNGSNK